MYNRGQLNEFLSFTAPASVSTRVSVYATQSPFQAGSNFTSSSTLTDSNQKAPSCVSFSEKKPSHTQTGSSSNSAPTSTVRDASMCTLNSVTPSQIRMSYLSTKNNVSHHPSLATQLSTSSTSINSKRRIITSDDEDEGECPTPSPRVSFSDTQTGSSSNSASPVCASNSVTPSLAKKNKKSRADNVKNSTSSFVTPNLTAQKRTLSVANGVGNDSELPPTSLQISSETRRNPTQNQYFSADEINILQQGFKKHSILEDDKKVVCKLCTKSDFFLVFYSSASEYSYFINIEIYRGLNKDWKKGKPALSISFRSARFRIRAFQIEGVNKRHRLHEEELSTFIRAGFNLMYFLSVSNIHDALTECENIIMERYHISQLVGNEGVDRNRFRRSIGLVNNMDFHNEYVMTMPECRQQAKADMPMCYENLREIML